MKYVPLSKKYYTDSKSFDRTVKGRFEYEYVRRFALKIGEHTAFIVPTFEECTLLSSIYESNNMLCNIKDNILGVISKELLFECLTEEIDQSNKIEGVASSKREVKDSLERPQCKGRKRRFQGIASKYKMLIDNKDYTVKSCNDIRKLYNELVLPEVIEENPDSKPDGEIFRHYQVDVLAGSGSGKTIHSGVYPESRIIEYMTEAIGILNDESMPELVNIAVFHYLFGYIHPFYDGNGRMSRFISSCYIRKVLDPFVAFRLAYTIKKDVSQYYRIFDDVNKRNNCGDLTPFVIYFLEVIDKSVAELCELFTNKVEKLKFYRQKLNKYFENEQIEDKNIRDIIFMLTQNALFVSEGLSAETLAKYLKISRPTYYRKIQKIDKRLIAVTKDGRRTLYSLNLNVLE